MSRWARSKKNGGRVHQRDKCRRLMMIVEEQQVLKRRKAEKFDWEMRSLRQ